MGARCGKVQPSARGKSQMADVMRDRSAVLHTAADTEPVRASHLHLPGVTASGESTAGKEENAAAADFVQSVVEKASRAAVGAKASRRRAPQPYGRRPRSPTLTTSGRRARVFHRAASPSWRWPRTSCSVSCRAGPARRRALLLNRPVPLPFTISGRWRRGFAGGFTEHADAVEETGSTHRRRPEARLQWSARDTKSTFRR